MRHANPWRVRAYHAVVTVRERGEQFRQLVRTAVADLFDQRRPFGRLALTQVVLTAGDTVFAVSLAGSLFFSISPEAAKSKIVLYLLLTIAPFAVVAPALGPLVDRSRGARRAMVVTSALGRAVLCVFLARDIHSLLLFPEAFAMLVLSKVFLITKGALVPEMAALGMLDAEPAADLPGDGSGAPAGHRAAPDPTPPYGTPAVGPGGPEVSAKVAPGLAALNARLGLLASLSAFVAAGPAIVVLKLAGASGVLWLGMVVFLAGGVAAARLPVTHAARRSGRRGERPDGRPAPGSTVLAPDGSTDGWSQDALDVAALSPIAPSEVLLAMLPMSVLKALVGFLTFLFAFGLRRQGAATWWFGLLLGSITAGALVGVLLVARIRRALSEHQILVGSLWLVAAVAGTAILVSGRLVQVVVAFGVGVAGSVSKPSFDALMQQHVAEANQGRAFSRSETRFQLAWVLGSFFPVVLTLSIATGDVVILAVAVVGALVTMSSLSAEERSRHTRTRRSVSGHGRPAPDHRTG